MSFDPAEVESGFQAHLGYRHALVTAEGSRIELLLGPQHLNRLGVPHGGLHAALLDTALGFACGFEPESGKVAPLVTLNLNVSYLAPPNGSFLTAVGRVVGGGRKVRFAEGEIVDETGLVLARASGTFRRVEPR